jgi:diguanylate cyclase (GGDEF)-like protein/PAS domain S-box-containing protein
MSDLIPSTAPEQPPTRIATFVATILLFLGALGWLYQRAEAVDPEQHFAYTQQLRDLREIDARTDRELLSNRQELVRNYDAMARYLRQAFETSERLAHAPDFLSASEQPRVKESARLLQDTLRQKTDLIERFKRHHSVLRNSLAYFPVAATNLLDAENGQRRLPPQASLALGHYTRHVLAYARAPGSAELAQISEARQQLVAAIGAQQQRTPVDNLLRHGDVIAERMGQLDQLTHEVFSLHSEARIENLNRTYAQGHATALDAAARYRKLMYALAAALASLLAWTLMRLDRTGRSLASTHAELATRYAAQLVAEKDLQLHATAFRNAHDGIALTDTAGNILDVNPAFSRITGYERDEVIGRNPRMLKSGRHDAEFYAALWRSLKDTDNWRGEIWNRNKYGEIYPELLSISAVHDAAGELTNYVAVFADISRLKAQERQLRQMAYYDALTDLPNRALLADRLVQGIQQTRRTQTLMAVCYLDLDGFKTVNDSLGHDAGDRLLVEMATRLKATLRGGDTVARLGGDEFVLLLVGLESIEECRLALERLLNAIAQPILIEDQPVVVSASIGVALFPQDDSDADTLMRHADQAMYQAKQSGKNRYHIFDVAQDHSARTHQHRLAELRQALDRGEYVLHYQPKVNMRLGRVVGAEALIRWNHPERGLVPPAEFLPLIENNDLIKEIGDWVIATALAQMGNWRQSSGLVLPVSVNVAGRQLQDPAFGEGLKGMLGAHPSVASQLELEVLETTAIEDIAMISRVIEECRTLGVAFALDDFGTGYSSLTYLKRLPVKTIKIDQSFVRDMLNDANNLVIVQGVIGLTHAFQRQAIAEGVETAEHGRLLVQLDCDLAQGYGIARPMPAAALPEWVAGWRPDPSWQEIRELYWDNIDYPLLLAEVEHRNWVAQLVFTTQEFRPVPHKKAGDSLHCNFGRWYYGVAQTNPRYTCLPAFALIDAPHRRVHAIAMAIDKDWREGRIEKARGRIPELLGARDSVLQALRDLQRAVASRRPLS